MSDKKKRSSKNLRINTRIVWTTVLAIVIPLVIIASMSSVAVNKLSAVFGLPTVTTSSYSPINQIQWDQAITGINGELTSDETDGKKLAHLKSTITSLENIGTSVYIAKDGEVFYQTDADSVSNARRITDVDLAGDLRYFSNHGLVMVSVTEDGDTTYTVLLSNSSFTMTASAENETPLVKVLFGRTGIMLIAIVILFVIAIVITSFITSRTIVKPIKKIAHGADEIARGNLNYKIDYKSTNELGQTVDSFNEMRLKLKESIDRQYDAIEQRNVLIAGIAHDLRTPLTSARGYAEGLIDGIANTPEKQSQYLRTICSSINQTEKILDDLLTVSRLQLKSYKLSKEEVDLVAFAQDGAEEIKLIAERHGFDFALELRCNAPVMVSIDTDAFERVISNIISNSIKYAREGVKGSIKLTLTEYERSVIMEIEDNGIGVDKKSLPKIFDTMYRADPARTTQGSGLGLSVCKQIVELHSGTIWASSREEGGLTVYISLPKIIEEKQDEKNSDN